MNPLYLLWKSNIALVGAGRRIQPRKLHYYTVDYRYLDLAYLE